MKKKKTQLRLRKCNEEEEDSVEVEKVFCPRAVEEYRQLGGNHKVGRRKGAHREESLISRASKHLSAVGWTFHYVIKHWSNKSKRELRYVPPNAGRKKVQLPQESLHTSPDSAFSNWGQIQAQGIAKQPVLSPLRFAATRNEPKQVHGIGKGPILLPRGEGPDSSKKAESFKKDDKMVVYSPAPQAHSSRGIFPRMIDANMVLPGDKVHYRSKARVNMLEGRISREGIICMCSEL